MHKLSTISFSDIVILTYSQFASIKDRITDLFCNLSTISYRLSHVDNLVNIKTSLPQSANCIYINWLVIRMHASEIKHGYKSSTAYEHMKGLLHKTKSLWKLLFFFFTERHTCTRISCLRFTFWMVLYPRLLLVSSTFLSCEKLSMDSCKLTFYKHAGKSHSTPVCW